MYLDYKDIDFEEIWQNRIRSKNGHEKQRVFDDKVEREFWEKLAPNYDKNPTLYDYSKEVFKIVESLIEKGSSLIEIGCGTGKFTIPLSNKCKDILAVDFSKDMLKVLKEKIENNNINNIRALEGKWEDANIDKMDYILSVNSLYRVWNIKDALRKMNALARKAVIIVRTIQKPMFNQLYMELGIEDQTVLDYIYLENIIHSLGIYASMQYIDVKNNIYFNNIEDIYRKIEEDIGRKANNNIIDSFIEKNFVKEENKYVYTNNSKVAIISWKI